MTNRLRQRVAADQTGAVMVMGIFMCTCLVGALWYIAGIGDAVVYRERMQEAADSVAMSTAVLHARGMNMLVMINLAMAAVLAIRVALKVLQAALAIATVVVFACTLVPPPFNPLEPACALALPPMRAAGTSLEQLIKTTREPINRALVALNTAAKGLAKVIPAGATAGGIVIGQRYKPLIITPALPYAPAVELPVTDGTTGRLCKEAGEAMIDMMKFVSPEPLDVALSFIEPLFSEIVARGGNYFCELDPKATPPDLSSLSEGQAKKQCDDELNAKIRKQEAKAKDWHTACDEVARRLEQDANKNGQRFHEPLICVDDDPVFGRSSSEPKSAILGVDELAKSTRRVDIDDRERLESLQKEFDKARQEVNSLRTHRQKCIDDQKKEMKKKQDENDAKSKPSNSNNSDKTPRKTLPEWHNGCAKGQIVAEVIAAGAGTDFLNRSPKGVRIAALGNRSVSTIDVPMGSKFSYAQAEFYFDCGGIWTDHDCNGPTDPGEDSMWRMRWRARLRRYNNPGGVASVVEAEIVAAMVPTVVTLAESEFARTGSLRNRALKLKLIGSKDFQLH